MIEVVNQITDILIDLLPVAGRRFFLFSSNLSAGACSF